MKDDDVNLSKVTNIRRQYWLGYFTVMSQANKSEFWLNFRIGGWDLIQFFWGNIAKMWDLCGYWMELCEKSKILGQGWGACPARHTVAYFVTIKLVWQKCVHICNANTCRASKNSFILVRSWYSCWWTRWLNSSMRED